MVEAPQSFIVREECEKAASQNGFRRVLGEKAGWAAFRLADLWGVPLSGKEQSEVKKWRASSAA
jgi:hypothetical protein